jgi:SpoIID/LytB domain protein
VYSDPRQASEPVRQAIQRTRQLVLSWQDQPIHAVYHASNGGVSAPLQEAWDADPLPYLQTGLDRRGQDLVGVPARAPGSLARLLAQSQPFLGVDHPLFRWSRWLEPQQIAAALRRRGITVGQVRRLAVLERGSSGRVLALAIEGSAGRTVLRLDAIRRTLRTLPSTLFELEAQANGSWRLQGGGFGHGAGLSQAGAIDLGRAGWSFQQILARYYPGTRLLNLQRLTPDPPGNDP